MFKSIIALFNPLPKYLADFYKLDYGFKKYAFIGVFLAVCILINYSISFESNYVFTSNYISRFLRYFIFYSFAYYGGVAIVAACGKPHLLFLKNIFFWFLSILGILIFSFDASFHGSYKIAKYLVSVDTYFYVGKLVGEFQNFFTLLFPLLLLWIFIKKKGDSFFGLTTRNVRVKPYIIMLLVMIPLITIAAHSSSFLKTYPTFKSYQAEDFWNISVGWLVAVYEFLYAFAFLSVELFFRGFLVIGLARIMGKDAIIPMVCMYAFIHFEKPMGEAISSIFGGYLLGVFAYYSKNIWGGVFIHAGIALLMELIAALMKF